MRVTGDHRLRRAALPILVVLAAIGCAQDGPGVDGSAPCSEREGASCPCPAGARCSRDEVCFGTRCDRLSEWTLHLADPAARSCDVLLELGTESRFVAARWSDGIMGHAEARARLLGLAFISAVDAPLAERPVHITVTGPSPDVRRAFCADRAGDPLARIDVRLAP